MRSLSRSIITSELGCAASDWGKLKSCSRNLFDRLRGGYSVPVVLPLLHERELTH
jgi:hypothetical protein